MATIERAIPVGGASLNFKIVGGTTQPSNPKENTIWANTAVAIGQWAFSSTTPSVINGVAVNAGDIWIETSNNSTFNFNALKKNEINVELAAVKQYDGARWLNCAAYIFQDNAWTQFSFSTIRAQDVSFSSSSELTDEGGGNWNMKLLSTGTVTFHADGEIDIFAVGGGGGGGISGGGGGYTTTVRNVKVSAGQTAVATIGAGGAATGWNGNNSYDGTASTLLTCTANGGKGGGVYAAGGDGGSGGGGSDRGAGGTDGSDGSAGVTNPKPGGKGQGSTTQGFGEANYAIYSAGGHGNAYHTTTAGANNTGDGGDGEFANGANYANGAAGGSGIIIIRNARA